MFKYEDFTVKNFFSFIRDFTLIFYPLSVLITYMRFFFYNFDIFLFLGISDFLKLAFPVYIHLMILIFIFSLFYVSIVSIIQSIKNFKQLRIINRIFNILSYIFFICLFTFFVYLLRLYFKSREITSIPKNFSFIFLIILFIFSFIVAIISEYKFIKKKDLSENFSLKIINTTSDKKNTDFKKLVIKRFSPTIIMIFILISIFITVYNSPYFFKYGRKCSISSNYNKDKSYSGKILFISDSYVGIYNPENSKTDVLKKESLNNITCTDSTIAKKFKTATSIFLIRE